MNGPISKSLLLLRARGKRLRQLRYQTSMPDLARHQKFIIDIDRGSSDADRPLVWLGGGYRPRSGRPCNSRRA
jgi:hypothetical protein